MNSILILLSFIMGCNVHHGSNLEGENAVDQIEIETLITEPIKVENMSMWVLINKTGPIVYRGTCRLRGKNQHYTCNLPGPEVKHTKNPDCSEADARFLAEYVSLFYEDLPFTIFNGWKWKILPWDDYEKNIFDLEPQGGSWQNAWEGILTQSLGQIESQWLTATENDPNQKKVSDKTGLIEIRNFTSMRTRDGYPNQRKF